MWPAKPKELPTPDLNSYFSFKNQYNSRSNHFLDILYVSAIFFYLKFVTTRKSLKNTTTVGEHQQILYLKQFLAICLISN